MIVLYVVRHEYEAAPGINDVKHIGVYSSREKAEEAIIRLRRQPGFSAFPDNFKIYEMTVNQGAATEMAETE